MLFLHSQIPGVNAQGLATLVYLKPGKEGRGGGRKGDPNSATNGIVSTCNLPVKVCRVTTEHVDVLIHVLLIVRHTVFFCRG